MVVSVQKLYACSNGSVIFSSRILRPLRQLRRLFQQAVVITLFGCVCSGPVSKLPPPACSHVGVSFNQLTVSRLSRLLSLLLLYAPLLSLALQPLLISFLPPRLRLLLVLCLFLRPPVLATVTLLRPLPCWLLLRCLTLLRQHLRLCLLQWLLLP